MDGVVRVRMMVRIRRQWLRVRVRVLARVAVTDRGWRCAGPRLLMRVRMGVSAACQVYDAIVEVGKSLMFMASVRFVLNRS